LIGKCAIATAIPRVSAVIEGKPRASFRAHDHRYDVRTLSVTGAVDTLRVESQWPRAQRR